MVMTTTKILHVYAKGYFVPRAIQFGVLNSTHKRVDMTIQRRVRIFQGCRNIGLNIWLVGKNGASYLSYSIVEDIRSPRHRSPPPATRRLDIVNSAHRLAVRFRPHRAHVIAVLN